MDFFVSVETLPRRDEKKLRELISMSERKMGRRSRTTKPGSTVLESKMPHMTRDAVVTNQERENWRCNIVTGIPPPSFAERANPAKKARNGPVTFDGHVYWMASECKDLRASCSRSTRSVLFFI